MNDMADWGIEVEKLTPQLLINKFRNVEQNYNAMKSHLLEKTSYFRMESYKTSEVLFSMIENVKDVCTD